MTDKQIKSILALVWNVNYYMMQTLRIVEDEIEARIKAEENKEPREFC